MVFPKRGNPANDLGHHSEKPRRADRRTLKLRGPEMSISSLNDWQKLAVPNAKEGAGDWLRFERPSSLQRVLAQERELESRRRAAYAKFVELVENDQLRVPPKLKVSPLSYEDWLKYLP